MIAAVAQARSNRVPIAIPAIMIVAGIITASPGQYSSGGEPVVNTVAPPDTARRRCNSVMNAQ
jgi:hypothetical protein